VVLTYPGAETSTALSRKIVVPSERKISGSVKLGVLGAGLYAKAVILPIMKKQKETELVGIASASGTNASHAAKKFGFRYASSDGDQLIQDPEVNTLAVLTRHHLHAEQTLAGLRAGKHVFCEKPLAMNNEQLEEIESQLQQPDCPLLMVGYNRRFAPLAIQLKTYLDERHEPLMAYYRVNAGLLPLSHWTHDPQQGGGRIIGEGCHFIDFLLWLVGEAPQNVSVKALPDDGKYRQDNVQVTMTFPDGSIGTVVYLANGDKAFSKERVEVFTGGKVAVLDDFNRLEMVQGGRRKVKRTRLRQDKGHRAGWEAFVKAITNGGQPPIPYSEMMASMRAAFAAAAAIQGE
jgi:predicted dehydrogenase